MPLNAGSGERSRTAGAAAGGASPGSTGLRSRPRNNGDCLATASGGAVQEGGPSGARRSARGARRMPAAAGGEGVGEEGAREELAEGRGAGS